MQFHQSLYAEGIMNTTQRIAFEIMLEENKKIIRQHLAAINIYRLELEAMIAAYEKSVREQHK
jgi:hypothetical protein